MVALSTPALIQCKEKTGKNILLFLLLLALRNEVGKYMEECFYSYKF
jgi:hypothetical protein